MRQPMRIARGEFDDYIPHPFYAEGFRESPLFGQRPECEPRPGRLQKLSSNPDVQPRRGMMIKPRGEEKGSSRRGMAVSGSEPVPPKRFSGSVERVYREYRVKFSYDEKVIARIKEIPNRRWEKTEKCWYVPANQLSDEVLSELGFELPEKPADGIDFSFMDELPLRPYQREGVIRLARDFDLNGFLGDEMGLGKSCQTVCAIRARAADALPALLIVPASLKANWKREIEMWHPGATVEIISGRAKDGSKFTRKADYTIINYDILDSWLSELMGKFKTMVLDECHKIKESKTIWTKAAKRLGKKIKFKIALSGTPITNRPIEFFNVLNLLSPQTFPNWKYFATTFCDPQRVPGVYDRNGNAVYTYKGSSNSEKLHKLASPFMIRRLKKDVMDDLPEKNRIIVPVEIDFGKYMKAEEKAMRLDTLSAIEKCRQAAIEGKMKAAIDWIENYLENGKKLVVFATHTETLDILEKKFKDCARIDGDVPSGKRQAEIDKFQNDPDCRLFIGNLQAAGVGITLTAASATLTVELGWVPGEHWQAEDRVHRIGQKAESVEAYYMIAQGTIDEIIMGILDHKMKDISKIVDGKKVDRNELLCELKKEIEAPQLLGELRKRRALESQTRA